MIKAKIKTITGKRSEYVKEFDNIESFNNYKEALLDGNCTYFKYQLLLDGANLYTESKTEYGNSNRNKVSKSKSVDNTAQKNSRNNQLALSGNKMINLNMTPARQRSLMKWILSGVPITKTEISFIKSMFCFDKISVSQYSAIETIKSKVSRRVRV